MIGTGGLLAASHERYGKVFGGRPGTSGYRFRYIGGPVVLMVLGVLVLVSGIVGLVT